MFLTRRELFQGLSVSTFAAVLGCSRLPDPTPIAVELNADANVNPNEDGEPSPIVVRIYELKGTKAFNNADFFDFVDDDNKLLGADLIGSAEYELTPGKSQKYDRDISSEATHLGVIAGFRDIQSAQWRDSIELQKEKKNEFVIYLTSLAVRIQKLRKRRLGVF
ncbi:type VI secretion system lipoprotein TssJ [Roseibium polysiphoniae]|uniref:Type VI secretion system lipoprotein TssJ n=1 Tax=Roseibium polysiphoniae TaxID=2571221 RepID=A0A944GVL7_9HYPH|nr:type VI secretion system lipoprotein TssJ [Roseibium polysiphoniae]MBS8262600.1 type VI secretion system lipoprotein TssJ [Roseibium polysiphoniae]